MVIGSFRFRQDTGRHPSSLKMVISSSRFRQDTKIPPSSTKMVMGRFRFQQDTGRFRFRQATEVPPLSSKIAMGSFRFRQDTEMLPSSSKNGNGYVSVSARYGEASPELKKGTGQVSAKYGDFCSRTKIRDNNTPDCR